MTIKPKIGVVSCSGECCSLGSVSRIATRRTLESLKPKDTVTICLPLFLAGDSGERGFAKKFPTIAVEGCERLCATKAIEKYSGTTASTINVKELLEKWNVEPPASRREFTENDLEIVERVAKVISENIDNLMDELDD